MDCSTPSFPVHQPLSELAQTHVHQVAMPSNHLILCHPLLLPSIFPRPVSFPMSQFFTWGSQSIGASASASVLPMNEYSGLISFRIDWLDLLAVQRTLKSLFQHHRQWLNNGNSNSIISETQSIRSFNLYIAFTQYIENAQWMLEVTNGYTYPLSSSL